MAFVLFDFQKTIGKINRNMQNRFELDTSMNRLKLAGSIAILLALGACAGKEPPEKIKISGTDTQLHSLLVKLSDSAARIEQAAQEQRMMEAALRMPDMTENQYRNYMASQAYEPDDLKYEISMPRFNGPAEKIVLGIANSVGWSFGTEGRLPPVPEVLSKEYRNKRAIDALKDISYSVDTMVVVDAANKRIVVRYKGE